MSRSPFSDICMDHFNDRYRLHMLQNTPENIAAYIMNIKKIKERTLYTICIRFTFTKPCHIYFIILY